MELPKQEDSNGVNKKIINKKFLLIASGIAIAIAIVASAAVFWYYKNYEPTESQTKPESVIEQSKEDSQITEEQSQTEESKPQDVEDGEEVIVGPEGMGENGEVNLADWQVYRNKEYGFEIRYPQNWFLKEYNNQVFIDIKEIPEIKTESEVPLTAISISIYKDKDPKVTADRIINSLQLSDLQDNQVVVGGISAQRISGFVNAESYIRNNYYDVVLFQRGRALHQIVYTFEDKTYVDIFTNLYQSLNFK